MKLEASPSEHGTLASKAERSALELERPGSELGR